MIGLDSLPGLDLDGTAWMLRGNCAQSGGDAWHPNKGERVEPAKRVCRRCPVKAECLEWALANDVPWGVWGGLSENERRPLRRQRKAQEAA